MLRDFVRGGWIQYYYSSREEIERERERERA
jgi:hypothetical protein